nr:MAG TPA: hypothetical protein [Caudoviricetes sp.]
MVNIINIPPRGVVRNPGRSKTPSQSRIGRWGSGGGGVNIQNTATHAIGEWWGGGGRPLPHRQTLNRYTPRRATQTPPTYPSTRTP